MAESILSISPKTLRSTLENLGPTYVKVGQYLALRPDLLPQDVCDELLLLTDQASFFPFEEARDILIEDLGQDPEQAFAEIHPVPVAAASLSQVYQARTHDGEVVAVKVQRPGMAARVHQDLKQARAVRPLMELFRPLPGVSIDDVLNELEGWMALELDFESELRNLRHMGDVMAEDSRCRIPKVYPALSGRRVLTMEFLAGTPFSEVLRLVRQDRQERLVELGIDVDLLASNLLRCCLEQTFRHEFFHADLHPGNIIALGDGVVGFVDFGLTETLEPHLRAEVRHFVGAAYRSDDEGMLRALRRLALPSEPHRFEQFRTEFQSEHRQWLRRRAQGSETGVSDSPLRQYMIGVMRAARISGLRLPSSLISLYRSVLTAEVVARGLSPSADLLQVGRTFFIGLQTERVLNRLHSSEMEKNLLPFLEILEESPDKYLSFATDLAEGRYILRVESTESLSSRRNAARRTRLVTLAILLVAVAILLDAAKGVVLWGLVPVAPALVFVGCALSAALIVNWRRL